jgi:hypothetical protein
MAGSQSSGRTRVLIVANRTAATQRLLDVVDRRAAETPCTFTLLVPDAAHRRDADWTLDTARRLLSKAAAAPVGGLAGGPDPFEAVREAVATGEFDEILISTLPRGVSRWLRRDLITRVRGLGLPVTAIIPGDRPRRSLDEWAMDSMGTTAEAYHSASRGSGRDEP